MPTAEEERDAAVAELRDFQTRMRTALSIRGGADPFEAITALGERAATAEAELTRLKPLAADGETYRKSLVTEALTEGKRAFGEGFNEEQYRSVLDGSNVEAVKLMRDNFKTAADKMFPAARQSTDDTEDKASSEERRRPARRRAYAGV